jgi:hypothetical protein
VFVNPFREDGEWHKANLHTHTRASDGQASAEERMRQYREAGYSVLAITDHGVISQVASFTTAEMVLLDGVEVTVAAGGERRFYHLLCLNVHAEATVPAAARANDVIAWARREGGESFVAHPYWSGNDLQDLLLLRGHIGLEVYNAGCKYINKPCSSVHWDNMLDRGLRTPAIAVDDAHTAEGQAGDLFAAWTMLKLNRLDAASVMEALRTGRFYSSTGPRVRNFGLSGGSAYVECDEAREIHLMAANWHGMSFFAPEGGSLSSAEAEVAPDWRYVRAEIVGAKGGRAWTNPIYL